ncbi:MAG: 3-oxoacyl-ACP synthase III family protein [Thermoplasmatota archaeon]
MAPKKEESCGRNIVGSPFRSRFESLGIDLPKSNLSTKELMGTLKHRVRLDLENITGISERRRCAPGEDTLTLAVGAAKDCLKHSRYSSDDLEMIINCSISKSFGGSMVIEPLISMSIKKAIGAVKARTLDITNACAGMFTGVYILNNFIKKGIVKKGMVVSGEHITPISDSAVRFVRTIASKQMASLTVGDAGAAVIMERVEDGSDGLTLAGFTTFSKYSDLCIGKPCKRAPGAYMVAEARKIHRAAKDVSPTILSKVLTDMNVTLGDFDHLIPHQTSERSIMSTVRQMSKLFGSSPKNTIINLKNYGNTASTTHFLALYKNIVEGVIKKGDRMMMVSHASGLVMAILMFAVDLRVESYVSED